MTVAASHHVINGPHDLFVLTTLNNRSTEGSGYVIADPRTEGTNYKRIGVLEDGFTLSWQFGYEDVTADHTGETIIDGIYTGIKSASLSGVLLELDSNRTILENVLWKHGGLGDLTEVGKMVSASTGDTYNYTGPSTVLVAAPRAGTPAATNTNRWYFYCCSPDPDETFELNFNNQAQAIPFNQRLYPVIVSDTITANNAATNKIYFNGDTGIAALTKADFTYRLWRRLAV